MKILLSVISNLSDVEQLHRIYKRFNDEGFTIEQFETTQGEIQIDNLPALIDQVSNKKEYEGKPCEFILLSNIKPLLFSWYRCYNSLVNGFVYFLESKVSASPYYLEHMDLITHLSSFNGISNETIKNKIYVNLNDENYDNLSPFLMTNYHFQYFELIENYDYSKNVKQVHINKCYSLNGLEYDLSYMEGKGLEKVSLAKERQNTTVNSKFINLILNEHFYFLYYFIISIYKSNGIEKSVKNSLLVALFQEIKAIDNEKKNIIHNSLNTYIQREDATFQEKAYFLSLLVIINVKKDLLQDIMNLMKEDDGSVEFHYPLLMNTLFYISKSGLTEYKEMYNDRIKVLEKILEYYSKSIPPSQLKRATKREKNINPKTIAIIAGQLLSTNHSPTLAILNRAKYIKKYSNCKVKIFVDDMFVYSQEEVVFPYVFASAKASSLRDLHKNFLKEEDISIYYSEPNMNRTKRINEFINEINKYQPDVIYNIGNDYSIPSALLYPDYPIFSQRVGGIPVTKWSDIYFGSQVNFSAYNMRPLCKYVNPSIRFDEFPPALRDIKRSSYQIQKDDFVLITVGNRLDVDLSSGFIELIISFLKDNKKVKWLLVGPLNNDNIKKYIQYYVARGQIIRVEYEKDLAALYKICDVFVNPIREGGGFSGLLAMKMGIPIITTSDNGDVRLHVGEENAVEGKKGYLEELQKLYSYPDYRKEKGFLLRKKYEKKVNNKKAVEDYIRYFEKALELYKNRM